VTNITAFVIRSGAVCLVTVTIVTLLLLPKILNPSGEQKEYTSDLLTSAGTAGSRGSKYRTTSHQDVPTHKIVDDESTNHHSNHVSRTGAVSFSPSNAPMKLKHAWGKTIKTKKHHQLQHHRIKSNSKGSQSSAQ